MINIKQNKVDARELHTALKSNASFSTWIKKKIKEADLQEGKDFTTLKLKSNFGRPAIEYEVTLESAKEICLLQQTEEGHKLRRELIKLSEKVETHKLLDAKKAALVYRMIETFQFGEYQLEAEDLHKDTFRLSFKAKENIHKAFADHRNTLLSINNDQLKQGLMDAFNKGMIHKPQAKNIRGRIALLDRYKLIRDAVADYLLSTGATTSDAINFADTVKEIAQFAKIEIRIKDEDNLFQEKINAKTPLQIQLEEKNVQQLLK